jgi:hypothetical protein
MPGFNSCIARLYGSYFLHAGPRSPTQASPGAVGFIEAQGFQPWAFYTNRRSGEYLISIAYGLNENRLEACATLRRRVAAVMDLVHRFEASADYDPAPGLEKIQASVLAINFADDELNPPELGIVDRAKQRVRNGQFVLIPAGSQTQGHMTLRKASIYAPMVADFLAKIPMAH